MSQYRKPALPLDHSPLDVSDLRDYTGSGQGSWRPRTEHSIWSTFTESGIRRKRANPGYLWAYPESGKAIRITGIADNYCIPPSRADTLEKELESEVE